MCTCARAHAQGIEDWEIRSHAVKQASATPNDESWQEAWEFITVNRTDPASGETREQRLPLGTVRASLGWLSRWQDVRTLTDHLGALYRDLPAEAVHRRYAARWRRRHEEGRRQAGRSEATQCSGG